MVLPGAGGGRHSQRRCGWLALALLVVRCARASRRPSAAPDSAVELRLFLTKPHRLWLGGMRGWWRSPCHAGQFLALLWGSPRRWLPDPGSALQHGGGAAARPRRHGGDIAAALCHPLRALAESYALLPPRRAFAAGASAEAFAVADCESFALALVAAPLCRRHPDQFGSGCGGSRRR